MIVYILFGHTIYCSFRLLALSGKLLAREGRSTAVQNVASFNVIHEIYDSPVTTPLFSNAENNAQKFDYRMFILGFCTASFWYKSVIFLRNLTTGQRRLPF